MAEGVICMNKHAVIRKLPDGTSTRQQIIHAAQLVDPSFKETQLRYLLGNLHDSGLIVREGRNQYRKTEKGSKKSIYTGGIFPCSLETDPVHAKAVSTTSL